MAVAHIVLIDLLYVAVIVSLTSSLLCIMKVSIGAMVSGLVL